jgi:hypothetical protein
MSPHQVNKHGAAFWLTAIAGLGVLDYVWDGKHEGMTLSETARWLFRTHTAPGRLAFTAFLSGGSYVLHQHITKPVIAAAIEEIENA